MRRFIDGVLGVGDSALTVTNLAADIIASDTDIDAATYQKMRGMSYQEVLRTNGQISFPEVLRQQKRL